MRKEVMSAVLSFGATSLYWLISSFRLEISDYGRMMQVQSVLLLIASLFSLRSHDLVFFLQKNYSWSLCRAFKSAFKLEILLTMFSAAVTFMVWHWPLLMENLSLPNVTNSGTEWSFSLLFANLTIMQGASVAYLRGLHQDYRVAKADLITAVGWTAALVWLAATDRPRLTTVLGFGFFAAATRTVALTAFALAAASKDQSHVRSDVQNLNNRTIWCFLISGQFTNLLKGNLLSIETLLLGRLVNSESVALFRVSRSFLNLSTVVLNLSYQKTFRDLAACESTPKRKSIISAMTKKSVQLWGGSLPFIFLAAMVYTSVQHKGGYEGLVFVLGAAAFVSLPNVLQQADFAALSLDARFGKLNIAYGIGFLVLLIGCALMASWMTLMIFLLISGISSFVRQIFLRQTVEGVK